MVKVTIKGETYAFDNERYPLAEAVALEEALGMPFGEWQRALPLGSAKALAGFVWLVLRRNDHAVPLPDILSGKFPLDENDVTIEADGPDPTDPPFVAPSRSTSERSPSASASGPGSGKTSPSLKPTH
jgi:hypothetical protein